jgi:hypothetical protein
VALEAFDVLGPLQHPESAPCLIVIALVRSQITGEDTRALIDDGLARIANAPLLGAAEKARRLAQARENCVAAA